MKNAAPLALSTHDGGLCWLELTDGNLTIDRMEQLLDAFDRVRRLNDIRGVVLHADTLSSPHYHDLRLMLQQDDLLDQTLELGRELCAALTRFQVPFCLAVSKSARGFGFEVLLHSPLVVLAEEATVTWGLQEIPLLPCFGGIKTLLDVHGPERMLDLLLDPEPMTAAQAVELNLAHATAPALFLREELSFQLSRPHPAPPSRKPGPTLGKMMEPLYWQRTKGRLAEPLADAFHELLRAWTRGRLDEAAEASILKEHLMRRDEVRNRLRFAASRATVLDAEKADEGELPARLMLVGLMPPATTLARAALERRFPLRVVDRDYQAMQKALSGLPAGGRLSTSVRFNGFDRYPVVVEALAREQEEKGETLALLGEKGTGASILLTQLTHFPLKSVERKYPHPTRLAGIHLLESGLRRPVVEIVRGSRTSQETLRTALRLFQELGFLPIVVQDRPAFLLLRLLAILFNETLMLIEEGHGPLAIEEAFRSMGFDKGPVRVADEVGFKALSDGIAELVHAHKDLLVPSPLLRPIVEAERLEKKFPTTLCLYRRDVPVKDNKKLLARLGLKGRKPDPGSEGELGERLTFLLVNAAVMALEAEVVNWDDKVDMALEAVLGLPDSRLGLLRHAEDLGWGYVIHRLNQFAERFGPRYAPCRKLYELLNETTGG